MHPESMTTLEPRQFISIFLLATTALALLFWSKELARNIQEAIDDLAGRGPRPPMHPMPANDARILNRRPVRETGPTRSGWKHRA